MTNRQKEIIKDNLRAYKHNFGYISIEKEDYGKGFYVFTSPERKEQGSWTQYCYNIDYLNGWLYGCVQAANVIVKPIEKIIEHTYGSHSYMKLSINGTEYEVDCYYREDGTTYKTTADGTEMRDIVIAAFESLY